MLYSEHVVLVDEQDNILGIEDKLKAHNSNTPLHKGFSVFLFNSKKEFLIQKRSLLKKKLGVDLGQIVFVDIHKLTKLMNKQFIGMKNLN